MIVDERNSILNTASVTGGIPLVMSQPIDLNDLLMRSPGEAMLISAPDDAMVNHGIHKGDLLIVDCSLYLGDGTVVLAEKDGSYLIRILRRSKDSVCLCAANPAYGPLVGEADIRVVGVVTAYVHRLA